MVLSDVEVSGVLGVKRGFDFETWTRRIRGLHYDFVVYAPYAARPTAIELEGKPGSAVQRTQADEIKLRASAAAGVRLLHWRAMALPDPAAIRAALAEPQFAPSDSTSANQSWWPALPDAAKDARGP
jgi:hypothetical protein